MPAAAKLDDYGAVVHRALQAAERMYPGGRAFAASGCLCHGIPMLVETPDGQILVVPLCIGRPG